MNEQTLSRSMPRGDIHINDIDMLGLREFDIKHAWSHPEVSTTTIESASNYIDYNRRNGQVIQDTTYSLLQ